ncbi:MAG: ABC transporter ATP-binding protein [Planctomycetaceae bacterium]|nr:ABC transporter ATP-binding protein [Planctomycetaceae bacterium]
MTNSADITSAATRDSSDKTESAAPSAATTSKPLAVCIRDLRVNYGKFEAVKGISLDIPQGEVFGFIGPNGAGKSSTIRVLATLQPRFRGMAMVCGLDVLSNPQRVREVMGYMPDFFGVYEDLTALEYLHFFAAAYKLPVSKRRGVIDDVLALTDLTHKADSPVDGLSRGMKQRLALARVLLHDPQVLLLDEPTSGLDPRARIEVRELLKALRGMGKTILISSHILEELSQLCTRIGIIETGLLVAEGSLSDIYRQLQLKRVIHIRSENASEELLARVREIHGVDSVEQQVDRWAIRLHEDQTSVGDLHQALVESGARLVMFQPEAMDMETAFMKLTEGKTA